MGCNSTHWPTTRLSCFTGGGMTGLRKARQNFTSVLWFWILQHHLAPSGHSSSPVLSKYRTPNSPKSHQSESRVIGNRELSKWKRFRVLFMHCYTVWCKVQFLKLVFEGPARSLVTKSSLLATPRIPYRHRFMPWLLHFHPVPCLWTGKQ